MPTDENGVVRCLFPDSGGEYILTNPRTGWVAHATYRLMCGYTVSGGDTHDAATLYSLRHVLVLRDSTEREQRSDPTRVQSVWRGKDYLNLMLTPLTQGGKQYWGYRVDSLRAHYGTPHVYLSVHHSQNGDVPAYTATEFASIPLMRVANLSPGDSVTVKVHTYEGVKAWAFAY